MIFRNNVEFLYGNVLQNSYNVGARFQARAGSTKLEFCHFELFSAKFAQIYHHIRFDTTKKLGKLLRKKIST